MFGRIGEPQEAAAIHRAAGLSDVNIATLTAALNVPDAAGFWDWMVRENGHVRRLDTELDELQRAAVIEELGRLSSGHHAADGSLSLPRVITLVTATA